LETTKQFKHLQWENSHVTADYGDLSEANSCWTNTKLSTNYNSNRVTITHSFSL